MESKQVALPSGETVPALGLGTWHMGESVRSEAAEVRALQAGIDLGFRLIDTAEMYGEGGAETVVGAAIAGRREGLFLVSKVYPHNASRKGTLAACERSLQRLKVESLDLYLLHWRGGVPLADTLEAFEQLKAEGKIRHWGVSNFDSDDMTELQALPSGQACATNQVLYHLGQRGIEWDLLPQSQAQAMPIMAYSPLGQGRILGRAALTQVAARHGVAPGTAALAWVLRQPGVIAIPKAADLQHLEANWAALDLRLEEEDLALLDNAFPPPEAAAPLAIL